MDDVPVKIVERYKPPPPVYQLPPTIANRLSQYRVNYYAEEQAFHYDYQLERSVLGKCQQWRRVRHQQQQARHMRLEQRKQERQRALEAKQKEMLGAVEYPSAAELSSDSDDDELAVESPTATTSAAAGTITTTTTSISAAESREKLKPKSMSSCNFNNILQPTILSGAAAATPIVTHHKRNSSLNYADFEYNMNSTPFDNIEMKTINDLDILAQVLHQTQLTQKPHPLNEAEHISEPEPEPENKNEQQQTQPELELAVTTLAETKATLDSVNFQVHCDDAQGIPAMYPTPLYNTPTQQSQQQLVYPHMVYNQHYYPQQQQQQLYPNQNYLQHSYVNGYGTPTQLPPPLPPHSTNMSVLSPNTSEADIKSRSVPDILRELTTELQQAEKRRARLHSQNENEQQALALTQPQQQQHQQQLSSSQPNNANIFQELTVTAQKLAQRISTMGFPLERVAKVVSLCGIDDKKVR